MPGSAACTASGPTTPGSARADQPSGVGLTRAAAPDLGDDRAGQDHFHRAAQHLVEDAQQERRPAFQGDEGTASVEANFATVGSAAADCELRGDAGAVAFSLFDVASPISLLRPGAEEWSELQVAGARSSGPDHILGVLHLAECIATGRQPLNSAAHAIHVLDVIDAAREAARRGETVTVPSEGTFAAGTP
ncbi:MAG: hypothetical protein ACRDPY_17120 [Streptosporangiaceae bacterium]